MKIIRHPATSIRDFAHLRNKDRKTIQRTITH